MPRDVARLLGAVTRELETVEKDGVPARKVVATRIYETDIDDLWDALTNPERLPRWFLPVSGDLELGGRFQLEGNAGGEITGCDPPRHLAITWEWAENVSWVEVTLTPETDERTVLRLEHLAHTPDDDEFWERYGPGAPGVGWDQALFGLDQHLATGDTVGPEEAMAWLATEEGRDFIRISSTAWGEVAIADGADPAEARAAAERTRAFYTGEEPGATDR